MFNRLFTAPRAFQTRLLLAVALMGCLAWLAITFFRRPAPAADPAVRETSTPTASVAPEAAPRTLEGEGARVYLEQTSEGQSLMQAVTKTRFGLKREKHSPFDKKSGAGYLAMSHDQNLNAWFGEDGITVHPTLSEQEHDKAWQLGFRLKSYGYGLHLTAATPIISHHVKENRIEYERGEVAGTSVVEWYENQSAGIEQGFTLSARPVRGTGVGEDEPLRLVTAVTGDLRARVKDEGQAIELSKQSGEGVLSYSKLTAVDAAGKKLAARMEASADGREIALVVDDREAVYPLVIDPLTATLEQTLEAGGNRQSDSRFGFAVALEGNTAVVGAWREDIPFTSFVDAGAVYTFTRSGSTWSSATRIHLGDAANTVCGWSVALSGNRVVYGCRGANNLTGRAYLRVLGSSGSPTEIIPSPGSLAAGDQFGYSVAISGTDIVVGAPFHDLSSSIIDAGIAFTFRVNSNGSVSSDINPIGGSAMSNANTGAAVAVGSDTVIVGVPGQRFATVCPLDADRFCLYYTPLVPFDGKGENFGESIAIDDNTAVIGAWGDDDQGTDAGAAYVFARTNGSWSHQQKLTASDGRANDHFGEHAVAIEGNMIVVGATGWDLEVSGDNAGAAYIFTRSGTVWSPQSQLTGAPSENFGIDVDIWSNILIIGARAAHAGGTAISGAAYVYRLNCEPPYSFGAIILLGARVSLTTTLFARALALPSARVVLAVIQ